MIGLIKHRSLLMLINRISVFAVFLCAFLSPFSALAEHAVSEKGSPVIAVGSEIDFPPYAIIDAKGRASGFSVELLEAVAETMGLHIKVTPGPWPEVLASFKARKYDLLPLVALSPKRADMATYTKPHTIAYDSFFVRRGSRPIASLAEAKGKDIVVMRSDAAHEKLHASGVRARIIETKTIPEAMRLLASGKHDAVLVPKLPGLIVLREAKLEEVIEAGNPIADYNRHFAFAVQRGNTELRDKLEQGLAIIRSTGHYDALYRRWFGGIEPQKRRLKTIIVNNYQPYTFINEKGEPDGFSVEIAMAVAKTMDLDLEIRAGKWDLSMKELETGGIDLIPMMAYSPERDEPFDFSVPYTIAYDTIFYKKGVKGIRSLNDLNGKTVIVTNNDAAHGYLLSSGLSKTMNISLANSLPDALKQLAAGKGDAAIMPKLVGLVVAKNLNLTGIDFSPEIIAGYNRAWCFAVRNGDQAMLDRLNQGLNIIKTTGEYDVIYKKWFGTLEGTKLQWKTILKYGSVVVLILLGSIFWNVMLNRQVKTKTVHLEAEIAERNRANEELKKIKNILSEGEKVAHMGTFEYAADTKTTHWSEEEYNIYGLDTKGPSPTYDVMLAKSIHPDDASLLHQTFTAAIQSDSAYDLEHRIVRPDGSVRWVHDRAYPYFDQNGKLVRYFGSTLDITERKQDEETIHFLNERISTATRSAQVGIWDWDLANNRLIWDDQMYALYGQSREEFSLAYEAWIKGIHPDDRASCDEESKQALRGEKEYDTEFRVVWPDRSVHFIKAKGDVFRDADGKPLRMIGVNYDITEHKQAEEKIQTSLREKETLLKEIHHRVKNNLQIISSLLNLQAKSIENEKLEGIFRECQDRITAMASVHQLLYKSQNFADINFGEYLQETSSQLFRSYKTGNSTISLVIHAENIMLPIDTAIPCGLIINELVTNALKYAFPGIEKGEIKIEMSQTTQGISLVFEDNGIGFPKDVDFCNSGTLGLKLIHLLVKQLDGSIEQFINGGTRYAILLKPETLPEG